MVFYFLTKIADPPMVIYMGEDKHENEDLLKWGYPEDIWFHVDDMSSAHVYLRPPRGTCIDDVPENIIVDCAQLVKANSILGSKTAKVTIVYTPFLNLKKTGGMDVGQVGFHDQKQVRKISVQKDNDVIKRLNKTKEERKPDLRQEKEDRDIEEKQEQRKRQQDQRQREKEEIQRRKEEEEIRSYRSIMDEDNMISNKMSGNVDYKAIEDDFM